MVSIIVTSSQNGDRTHSYLQNLAKFAGEQHEFLVVGAESEAATGHLPKNQTLRWISIGEDSPKGFSKAKNLAAVVADGEHLVFVACGTPVEPGWVGRMLACAENTGAGTVGPLPGAGFSNRTETRRRGKWFPRVSLGRGPMLVEKGLFKAARGFDDALYPGKYQDCDLCLKAALLGRKVYSLDNVRVSGDMPPGSRAWEEDFRQCCFATGLQDSNARKFCSKWGADSPDFTVARWEFFDIESPQGKRVLDLNAGAGATLLEALSQGASQAVGIQPDRGLLKIATTHLSVYPGCSATKTVKGAAANCGDGYDLIYAPWCLESSPNPRRLLRQARTLMSGNSRLIAIVRNSWSAERILPLLLNGEPRTLPRPSWGPTASPDEALGWFWDAGLRVLQVKFLHPPAVDRNQLVDRLLAIPEEHAKKNQKPYCRANFSEEFMVIAETMRHRGSQLLANNGQRFDPHVQSQPHTGAVQIHID